MIQVSISKCITNDYPPGGTSPFGDILKETLSVSFYPLIYIYSNFHQHHFWHADVFCVCLWENQKILNQDKQQVEETQLGFIMPGQQGFCEGGYVEKTSRMVDSEASEGQDGINNEFYSYLLARFEKHAAG